MERFCDLHTHSVFSDGTFTPQQILDEAQRLGLGAVALTDHNTVAGLPAFLEAARDTDLEAVAGVEFSVEYCDRELHMLALFVKPEYFHLITQKMEEGVRAKEESNVKLAAALCHAGYTVDYAAIKAKTPNGQVNRAHIAAELTRLGYTPDIQTAFQTLLSPKGGLYQPPRRPHAFEMIEFIRSIGAVSVIAHPFLDLKEEGAVRSFLAEAAPRGLTGVEVFHPKHDLQQRQTAQSLAREFGLKCSGGSDFHGSNKPDIRLGVGRGDLAVPMAYFQGLKKG